MAPAPAKSCGSGSPALVYCLGTRLKIERFNFLLLLFTDMGHGGNEEI